MTRTRHAATAVSAGLLAVAAGLGLWSRVLSVRQADAETTIVEPVQEGTMPEISIAFFEAAGPTPAVPSRVSYAVTDVKTRQTLVYETVLPTPTSHIVTFTLPAAATVQLGRDMFERRRLTLAWAWGSPEKRGQQPVVFTVENNPDFPFTPSPVPSPTPTGP